MIENRNCKTSIVLRFVDDYFSRSFKPTNGVFRIEHKMYFVDSNLLSSELSMGRKYVS